MTPAYLGFPPHFSAFRPAQEEAIEHALCSSSRFVGIGAPPGVGKSGIALALARLLGGRSVILTANLGLQQQYQDVFSPMGLHEIKGRNNYTCWEGGNCEDGGRMLCGDKEGCPYICTFKASQAADIVQTNYAFWLSVNERGQGMKQPDTLICDEAGLASEWLSRALDYTLTASECRKAKYTKVLPGENLEGWAEAAEALKARAEEQYTALKSRMSGVSLLQRQRGARELKQAESFFDRTARLSKLDDNWIISREEKDDDTVWKFECVWPGRYREKLFRYIPKVILLSATLRPKTLSLLGISGKESDFREWGRQFPLANGPVIHIPTTRVNWQMDAEGEKKWMSRIDEILSDRPDRKGIIHTVSYARAKQIVQQSRHRSRLMFNENDPGSPKASSVFARFATAGPGTVLVSPSFSTGWDFAGDLAEYQIIAKVPMPDTRSKLMKARCAQDPTYPMYVAAQELVQACGRVVRSDTDRGETFIIDDSIGWFMRAAKDHLPAWFRVRREDRLPQALEKI